jgi:hypothetical protein
LRELRRRVIVTAWPELCSKGLGLPRRRLQLFRDRLSKLLNVARANELTATFPGDLRDPSHTAGHERCPSRDCFEKHDGDSLRETGKHKEIARAIPIGQLVMRTGSQQLDAIIQAGSRHLSLQLSP